MSLYGDNPRFQLGSYLNQSARTTYSKECEEVKYSVFDQDVNEYVNKIGNRYTVKHLVFDLTEVGRDLLISYNATMQTYTPFYDKTNNRQVYVDAIFDPYTYKPQSCVRLILTNVDIDPQDDIVDSGLVDYGYTPTGHYAFDGVNDYVITPIENLIIDTGDRYVFECDFSTTDNGEIIFLGNSAGWALKLTSTTNTYYKSVIQVYFGNRIYCSVSLLATVLRDGTYYHLTVGAVGTLGSTYGSVSIKIDGVEKYIGEFNASYVQNGYPIWIGRTGSQYTKACNLNNIKLTVNNTIGGLPDEDGFEYPCNEAVPAGSEPYTGYTEDVSVYDNDGTPTNVEPNKATFFNPGNDFYWINEWLQQESLSPDNPYGRLVYLTHDVTLNEDADFEYEVDNVIDWEGVSITGRLHRRYVIDKDGLVVQRKRFIYKCYNIEVADYNNIKVFDTHTISFFPDSEDTINYYTANCGLFFLSSDSFIDADYVEIEIIPIGQLKAIP